MMYNIILFDLDGTLTDPAEGITNSVVYALKHWNIEIADKSTLNCFIGPPLYESFSKYFNFSENEAKKAVEVYREYFSVKGLYENSVYFGVEEMLAKLKSSGIVLAVASSKPEKFVLKILEHFSLTQYFDVIAGATMDGSRINKADVIRYALDKLSPSTSKEILMIGDREHDVFGAKEIGIDSLGVTYGYGGRKELENAGADFVVDAVEDIVKIILE